MTREQLEEYKRGLPDDAMGDYSTLLTTQEEQTDGHKDNGRDHNLVSIGKLGRLERNPRDYPQEN